MAIKAPQNKPAGTPEMGEVASSNDGRDITLGYVDALPLLTSQDGLLRAKGGNLKIYQEILTTPQVHATFQQRRLAVISTEWDVTPGGDSPRDAEVAEFVRGQVDRIRFDDITDKMLYGLFYGYAVAEVLWGRDGNRVIIDQIRVRERRRFGFAPDMSLRLLTTRQPMGEKVPDKKFWAFCTGADHDDEPYGLGLGSKLYWPAFFKRNGIKFWSVFLEKFGMPTVKGTYHAAATEAEQGKLLAACAAVQADSAVVMPEGMQIELIEAARAGKIDYEGFQAMMDADIAKVVLSQTMTTDDGSSQSQANVHKGVRDEVVTSDADLVCDSFNRDVVRWLVDFNFPGAPYPTVWRKTEEEENLNIRADRDEKLHRMGFGLTDEAVERVYGPDYQRVQSGTPAAAEDPPQAPTFAEGDDPIDTPAAFAETAGAAAAQVMDGLIDPIRQRVNQADSLEALRDDLLDAFGDMEPFALADLMQRILVAAELSGRYETNDPPPEVPEAK